ncbi:PhzF family phenazine biosynthesis protein [Cohnella sp. REN36]|uniref:PhzF family phenazine biosynthesis protein n=1 Tax=Cohnella sp. REN36 TaxID=2887347 RepID=UPI001D14ED81|nr:PhzF family phenazine biosynthesis protein [Cohnella sp. REN36]MCC3376295.1 PhzF family phenazine biosynthesis protein [Cohnella sp. REN36]
MKIRVDHYDAFSPIPHQGNPAGIVWGGERLSDDQMRAIAGEVGFNETAFPLPSDRADARIRFFTPGHEIDLCGHATMATLYALKMKGNLGGRTQLTIETRAGILPIRLRQNDGWHITMRQAAPRFEPFRGSLPALAHALGLEEDDIRTDLPVCYGSTGTWTLLVPIRHLSAFSRMKPDNARFPQLLVEMPRASVHPFCLDAYDPLAHMHARHFSSPFSGTVEDPVTGTASGVMGAYYARYIDPTPDAARNLLIEQGQEIGRDGRVRVTVANGDIVEITGTAVYVQQFEVSI